MGISLCVIYSLLYCWVLLSLWSVLLLFLLYFIPFSVFFSAVLSHLREKWTFVLDMAHICGFLWTTLNLEPEVRSVVTSGAHLAHIVLSITHAWPALCPQSTWWCHNWTVRTKSSPDQAQLCVPATWTVFHSLCLPLFVVNACFVSLTCTSCFILVATVFAWL